MINATFTSIKLMFKKCLKRGGMLKQRILTATVLFIVAIAGILFLPQTIFDMAVAVVGIMAATELAFLFWKYNILMRATFLAIIVIFFVLVKLVSPYYMLFVAVFWWLAVPYFIWQYSKRKNSELDDDIWRVLIGILVFVPFMIGLIVIRKIFGPFYLLYIITVVCFTDIGAFFAGKFWGKNLLVPTISPKKTIEGFLGGIILAMLIAVAGGFLLKFEDMHLLFLLTLTLVACLWSVIGDLFESMLKRQVGAKDSGILLPGHGGIFDRIDSLTSAIPIFALGLLLFFKPKIGI